VRLDTSQRDAGEVEAIASRVHARFPPWLHLAPTRSQSGVPAPSTSLSYPLTPPKSPNRFSDPAALGAMSQAALQQAGGGTWGGCVCDVDAIAEKLKPH
jgi:hypothetical protein